MNARVVIPTLNAGSEFRALLASLRAQRPTGLLSEIVVIDSSSTDATTQIAKEAGATVNIIPRLEFNHGATRTRAAAGALTEAVVFLVQDALPTHDNFLMELCAPLEEYHVAAAYARVVPRPAATALVKRDVDLDLTAGRARLRKRIANMDEYLTWSPSARRVFCHFNNVASAIRTDVFEKLPFRPLPFGEDLDWGKRALEAGHTIAYAPDAVVVHSHESGWGEDRRRQQLDAMVEYDLFGIARPEGVAGAFSRAAHLTWRDLTGSPLAFAPALRLAQAFGRLSGWKRSRASGPPRD